MSSNVEELHRALQVLVRPGHVAELRALDVPQGHGTYRTTVSGYFDDLWKMAQAAVKLNTLEPKGIYLSLNPVQPDLLARSYNRVHSVKKGDSTTADKDILARWWLPIDIDPIRPANVMATPEERQDAYALAKHIYGWLTEHKWPAECVKVDSGNGAHLLYRIDMPVNDEGWVHDRLKGLAFKFNTNKATVDTTLYNPARIIKLPGTVVRKGDNAVNIGRGWRKSKLLYAPDPEDVWAC